MKEYGVSTALGIKNSGAGLVVSSELNSAGWWTCTQLMWITTICHLLYRVLAELHSLIIFQELLDISIKERQQQSPKRKHRMDAITRTCKKLICLWNNVYQQGSSKVEGGIATYVKGRTDVTVNKNCLHCQATGKKKWAKLKWFSV